MKKRNLPDFRESYREAGEILSQRSNRLKLIEGLLFCSTVFVFAFLLREACLQLAALKEGADWLNILLTSVGKLLFWACQLLVTAPLMLGVLQMAVRMANGEDVFLPELFAPFASGKAYFRALVVLWPFFWKLGLFWELPNLVFNTLTAFFGRLFFLSLAEWLALLFFAVVWVLLSLRGFVRLSFLLQWRMPLPAAGKANRQIAGNSFTGGGIWWLCFFPRILLGFLTVGILLIADVIPRMMISYFRYAGRMTEYAFSSEEPNYE